MTGHDNSLNELAKRLGIECLEELIRNSSLSETPFVIDGVGSIARPLVEQLAGFGACQFVCHDPKEYTELSVASQCEPVDVGRRKVDVVAERLATFGAHARGIARDLYSVPDGVVTESSLVIASLDNRRADIGSNRRAARMQARLLRINIEPLLETVSVRAFDFRRQPALCVECQFTDRHYAAQRHPRSCDGDRGDRRTNSPRWLSSIAACIGVLAGLEITAGDETAARWFGYERQFCVSTGKWQESRLTPNPTCRWDHRQQWQNVTRLTEGPRAVNLVDLIGECGQSADERLRLRFCQQVALQAACINCGLREKRIHWIADFDSVVGKCPHCDGPMRAVPFWSYREIAAEKLRPVWEQQLSDWGVEPFAVVELSRYGEAATFVIGEDEIREDHA